MVDNYQQKYRSQIGRGHVYLADEFYLKAGLDFPPAEYYDDYCQIENGIGLARLFMDEFNLLEPKLPVVIPAREACLITGNSGFLVLRPMAERLNRIEGLSLTVQAVPNQFFGGNVSVTGLLTGRDIIAALGSNYSGKKVIIPRVILKQGQNVLLDDTSIEDIEQASGARILTVDGTAADLVNTVLYK
jgi:NifB/MoaA-like Fe-S oxidoreductase